MSKLSSILLVLFFVAACNNVPTQQQQAPVSGTDTAKQDFFPVTSFIKGQILPMDSLQVTPLKITVKNGKEDSVWIKATELKGLLQDFISVEINSSNLTVFFNESKFNDESTNAITFTYSPKGKLPDSIAVKHWDVYINPETGKVKRVYILKQLSQSGPTTIQQLTWQTDKSARITTIQNKADGSSEIVSDTRVIWSF